MPLTKIDKLPYEILLRFNFGGAHQRAENKLGDFEGAHYIEGTAIVDTDAGNAVVGYTPGPAQHLELAQVAALLGDRFAAFEAQQRTALEQIDAQDKQLAELQHALVNAEAVRAALEQKLADVSAHVASAAAAAAA